LPFFFSQIFITLPLACIVRAPFDLKNHTTSRSPQLSYISHPCQQASVLHIQPVACA
jgi:hypothetical protein